MPSEPLLPTRSTFDLDNTASADEGCVVKAVMQPVRQVNERSRPSREARTLFGERSGGLGSGGDCGQLGVVGEARYRPRQQANTYDHAYIRGLLTQCAPTEAVPAMGWS
jgi:hypothetical protein